MVTQDIWDVFNERIYLFILKRVKNKDVANDIFQNSFLKIHKNLHQLRKEEKAKSWAFQIVRNEINNYFNEESKYVALDDREVLDFPSEYDNICCFDKFITQLPDNYKRVIDLVYVDGLKQKDVATKLDVSLANVKALVRRSKSVLKKNFHECCKYDIDKYGKLVGKPNCSGECN